MILLSFREMLLSVQFTSKVLILSSACDWMSELPTVTVF